MTDSTEKQLNTIINRLSSQPTAMQLSGIAGNINDHLEDIHTAIELSGAEVGGDPAYDPTNPPSGPAVPP